MTVQFNLFGGTLLKLGTERHHHILNDIDSFDKVGCFGLTELAYGNNAVEMETTMTLDKKTDEWIVNTPTVQVVLLYSSISEVEFQGTKILDH